VKILTRRVYSGNVTKQVQEQFAGIVRRAFREFVNDRLSNRLKSALEGEAPEQSEATELVTNAEPQPDENGIVTTQDELDGFYVVKAIVREVAKVGRIFMRDTKSYCGILLDDNNRKPIVRLRFNASQKYLGTFDENKNETRHAIGEIDDIYKHADTIKATIKKYG